MPKYEAILFDFDGTLVESSQAIYKAYKYTFNHFYPTKDDAHIKSIVNKNMEYQVAFKAVFLTEIIDSKIEDYLQSIYLKISSLETNLFPGVYEIISFLEGNSYLWGIVTNKKRKFVSEIISSTLLSGKYDCLVCEEDVTNLKPDPESLWKACRLISKPPDQVVYVGDSISDIEAAKACNMDTIAVTYGYGNSILNPISTWGANFIISDIREIKYILKC